MDRKVRTQYSEKYNHIFTFNEILFHICDVEWCLYMSVKFLPSAACISRETSKDTQKSKNGKLGLYRLGALYLLNGN